MTLLHECTRGFVHAHFLQRLFRVEAASSTTSAPDASVLKGIDRTISENV